MRKLVAFVFVFASFYMELKAQVICGGSSYTITPTSTLTNPTGYTLNPGGFSPANGVFVVSPPSTTTYTILSSNSSTTIGSSLVTVTVNPQPNTAITLTQAICTNSFNAVNLGLTFSPATPPPAYTVSWTPIPASVLSPQTSTATNLTPGPYTVEITTGAGTNTCVSVAYFTVNPQPASAQFTVIPFGGIHSITCVQPTVELSASSSNSNITYTWSGASFIPVPNHSISLNSSNLGTFTVTGVDNVSGCSQTHTFVLGQNIAVPSSTISTSLINITCTQTVAPTFSATANPTVNVTHYIYSPLGGTFIATSYTTIYYPGEPGPYTHVVVNNENGCSVTKTFTVTTSDNYPVLILNSPNNYTLGCGTKSVGIITIAGASTTPLPGGGAVSYTLIGPGTSTVVPPTGTLGGLSSYTNITLPGTYTVIVRDNNNNCDTKTQVSVTQNIQGPDISAVVPLQILDCNTNKIILEGVSETPNIEYLWSFATTGAPGNVMSKTLTVNTNSVGTAVTTTVINNYTLTITDNNNACKSTTVVPMYQNLFPPTASVSSGVNFLTCSTPTVVLSNQSKTSIPPTTPFPTNQNVIGFLWEGPSPQKPLPVSSTYLGATVGIYTLTVKDLNNGCLSKTTYSITEGRIRPIITVTASSIFLDCGATGVMLAPNFNYGGVTSQPSFTWSNPPGVTSTAKDGTNLVGGPGVFTVAVTNNFNGCSTETTIAVSSGSLTAKLDSDTDQGYAPLTVNFTNSSFSSNGTNNIFATYSYGNGSRSGSITTTGSFVAVPISSTISPQTIYTQPGTYTVTMFVTKGACIDTAYKTIVVDIPSSLEVPNVFTPNNDGINDLFFLKASNISEINMIIYDRWGHIVYELTSETGNIEWDGKNAYGKEAAEGVYFYLLKTTGKDGVLRDQKGSINLYR